MNGKCFLCDKEAEHRNEGNTLNTLVICESCSLFYGITWWVKKFYFEPEGVLTQEDKKKIKEELKKIYKPGNNAVILDEAIIRRITGKKESLMITKEKREQFLVKLNEMSEGDTNELIESMRIGETLGFDRRTTFNFVRYFEQKGSIKFGDDAGGAIRITAEGIDEADKIRSRTTAPSFDQEDLAEEMYFSPESQLDIQKKLARVLRQATNSLWICDPYMDEKIVEEISNIQAPEIRLLTTQPKGLFKQRLNAAKEQFSKKIIEAKVFNKCHDRFYIIDQLQVWALGSSLNKAGKKATLLNKVKDEGEKQKIVRDFTDWWALATEINT